MLARILAWQIRMDQTRGDYLMTPVGRQELEEIRLSLEQPWLEFSLEEKWLEVKRELLTLVRHLRVAGKLHQARETLNLAQNLALRLPR